MAKEREMERNEYSIVGYPQKRERIKSRDESREEKEERYWARSTWYQTSGTLVYMGREATGPLYRAGVLYLNIYRMYTAWC